MQLQCARLGGDFGNGLFLGKLHTINFKKLSEDISSGRQRIFCFEDRLFSSMAAQNQEIAKQLKQLLEQHYRQVGVVNNYGQFGLTLYIFASLNGG